MANALTPVEFHGATLSVILINGVLHVALKPICEAIGLDWKAQQDRIKRHPVLNSVGVITTSTGTDGKQYDMLMLPLDKLDGWLFGVSVRRVRPELRERLTQYQAECFDALARHFGTAVPRQDIAAPVNIHAQPEPAIDPAALLLSGQSSMPLALSDAQQAALDKQAWLLAHEAYTLARQHIARRIAYKTTPAQRAARPSCVQDVIAGVTLGNALAHAHHHELRSILRVMQAARDFSIAGVANLETLIKDGLLMTNKQGSGDSHKPMGQLQRDVLDILVAAHRHGATDMTADEIQKAYEERVTNRRIKDGPFAGRISEMAAAGLLLTSATKRQSRIGGGPRKNAYRAPSAVACAVPASSASFY